MSAGLPRPAKADPTGAQVTSGSATVTTQGAITTVRQTSASTSIDWSRFDIGAGETVRFDQPGASAVAINRVLGNSPSSIDGRLLANGRVFLINPNGVLFGAGARVDVGGLVASSLDLASSDPATGRFGFAATGGAGAGVVNRGLISTPPGGAVALIGAQVLNAGVISTPAGTTALAAGERVSLRFGDAGGLSLSVDAAALRALASNEGRLSADGGTVLMTARARDALQGTVLNQSGIVEARAVSLQGGRIVLDGGDGGAVSVDGRLDASAAGAGQRGGAVVVTGRDVALGADAAVDARGAAGGGSVRIGGDVQGRGETPRAQTVRIADGAQVLADATASGAGGSVVVWSDGHTDFAGHVSARGAGNGDGGSAEVSGKQQLAYRGSVDLRADHGRTGDLLLDPYNVTISAGADANHNAGFTATGNNSVVNVTTLQAALATANVTVSTNTAANGAQSGDITVSTPITWASGNGLTLNAYRDITVSSGSTLTAVQGGSLTFTAGRHVNLNANISATNAALALNATSGALVNGSTANAGTLSITGATINLNGGTGTFNGTGGTSYSGISLGGTSSIAGGSLSFTGSSASTATNGGIAFASGGSLTLTGATTFAGSTGANVLNSGGLLFNGSYTLAANSALTATGSSSSTGNGILIQGAVSVQNLGGASVSFTGAGGSGIGLRMNGASSGFLATGAVGLTATSSSTYAANVVSGGTLSASNGPLTATLSANANFTALLVAGGTLALSASGTSGSLAIDAASATGNGLRMNSGTGLTSNGTVSFVGRSLASTHGLQLLGNNTITVGSGTFSLRGTSAATGSQYGVSLVGQQTYTAAAGASLSLVGDGTSNSGGIGLTANATLTTSGTVNLTGTGVNSGIALAGNNTVTASSGALAIAGTTTAGYVAAGGLTFAGAQTFVSSGSGLTLTGTASSSSPNGLRVAAGSTLSTQGGVTLAASSSAASAIAALGAWSITQTSGNLALSGTSSSSYGADFVGALSITNNGAGSLSLAGTGAAGGIRFESGSSLTTAGSVALHGTSAGATGLYLAGTTPVQSSNGTATLAGSSTSAYGINIAAAALQQSGSGSLALTGTSSSSTGLRISAAAVTLGGQVALIGVSTSGSGLLVDESHVTLNGGQATLAGTSASGRGVQLTGTDWFENAAGSYALQGSSASATAAAVDFGGLLTRLQGNVAVTGTATGSGNGVRIASGFTLNADGGTQTVAGSAVSGNGLGFAAGSVTVTDADASGSFVLAGSSQQGHGIALAAGTALATQGRVTFNGSTAASVADAASPDRMGVSIGAGSSIGSAATGGGVAGQLAVNGSAGANAAGVSADGALALTQTGSGAVALAGSSAGGLGVRLAGGTLTSVGSVSIATTASRLLIDGETLAVGSGSLAINGSAGSAAGLSFNGSVALQNTHGGSLALAGASTSGSGVEMRAGAQLAVDGSASISGSSGSGTGFDAAAPLSLASGSLALAGTSSSGGGMRFTSAATLANAGSGTLALAASGGLALANAVTSTGGVLSLTANNGAATQSSGASITAGQLLLGGSAASTLAQSGNHIGTVAGSAGAVDLYSADALTIGTVLGTSGVVTAGQPVLRSGGDLTLAAGASVQGASPVLAAVGGFHNLAGSAGVVAGSGRWLVYASDPATSSFGGLDSGQTALWNRNDAGSPPASVSETGNRYLFAQQPTLTFTSIDTGKTYGDDASASLASRWTVAGAMPAVAGAYLGDSAASLYTGAPTLGSAGSAATAGVAAGPYAISIAAGSLASTAGYALTYAGSGVLSVAPRALAVTADAQSRVYGDANPVLTYAASGLVNGDALTGALATTAGATSNVGSYAITQGTLGAGSNYSLSYAGNTLAVTPRALAVTADGQSRVYGDANPVLTYAASGLVNSDALTGALATAAGATSNVGSYAITQGSLAQANYRIVYTAAALRVQPRPLTIAATNAERAYGAADPVFGFGAEGLANGDRISAVTFATPADRRSSVGVYPVVPTGVQLGAGLASNYAVRFENGRLRVVPAPLSVSADDLVINAGQPLPPLSARIEGWLNGDTAAVLDTPVVVTAPGFRSEPGGYALHVSPTSASNYSIVYADGVVTVTPARSVDKVRTALRPTAPDEPAPQRLSAALLRCLGSGIRLPDDVQFLCVDPTPDTH